MEKGIGDLVGSIFEGAGDLLSKLFAAVSKTPDKELSYEEAMKYFIDHQADDAKIAKGAMIKEAVKDGIMLTQVFLDEKGEMVCNDEGIPLGRKITAVGLDAELLKTFKDSNVVMVG
jgi:hypothetical protein